MKTTILALALLSPAMAAAADAAAAPPSWSVGAGVLLGGDALLSSLSPAPSVPFVRASLERRVGAATWLVLGVAGTFEDDDAEPARLVPIAAPDGGSSWAGHVAVGVRRELTGAGAPLAVSALLLADVGGVSADRRYLAFDVASRGEIEVREDTRGVLAGISAGAAVERQLVSGLSVRIASPLLVAGWSWSEVSRSDRSAQVVRSYRAGVTLAPTLELRLAF